MSTNTLRMMGTPYDALGLEATGFHYSFGMRDGRTGMEDDG
jgi:hypothetical protein